MRHTEYDFVENRKPTGKKRTEKQLEKEKMERESALAAAEYYHRKQEETNRPTNPREPLKRTAGNNWVHVACALWTPEMKFGNAKALEPSEGIGTIPSARFEQICKLCKTSEGACVPCHQCHAPGKLSSELWIESAPDGPAMLSVGKLTLLLASPVHLGCAQKAGYTLGFDITPVKSSRRELVNTVTLGGESGFMVAAVWCKEHAVKTIVHPIEETGEDPELNALQMYARNYKQADLTLTGTVRKANLVTQSTKVLAQGHGTANGNRRGSGTANGSHTASRNGVKADDADDAAHAPDAAQHDTENGAWEKRCLSCNVKFSPRWWKGTYVVTQRRRVLGIVLEGTFLRCTCDPATYPPLLLSNPGDPYDACHYHDSCCADRQDAHVTGHDLVPIYATRESSPWSIEKTIERLRYGTPVETVPFHQCHKCHHKTFKDPYHLLDAPLPFKPLEASWPSIPRSTSHRDTPPPLPSTPERHSAHASLDRTRHASTDIARGPEINGIASVHSSPAVAPVQAPLAPPPPHHQPYASPPQPNGIRPSAERVIDPRPSRTHENPGHYVQHHHHHHHQSHQSHQHHHRHLLNGTAHSPIQLSSSHVPPMSTSNRYVPPNPTGTSTMPTLPPLAHATDNMLAYSLPGSPPRPSNLAAPAPAMDRRHHVPLEQPTTPGATALRTGFGPSSTNLPHPSYERRTASGASASPSLRNLLS